MMNVLKHFTEEERKDAIPRLKTRYMVNKKWICIVCDNHDYTLSGKCKHLCTRKLKDTVNRITMGKINHNDTKDLRLDDLNSPFKCTIL